MTAPSRPRPAPTFGSATPLPDGRLRPPPDWVRHGLFRTLEFAWGEGDAGQLAEWLHDAGPDVEAKRRVVAAVRRATEGYLDVAGFDRSTARLAARLTRTVERFATGDGDVSASDVEALHAAIRDHWARPPREIGEQMDRVDREGPASVAAVALAVVRSKLWLVVAPLEAVAASVVRAVNESVYEARRITGGASTSVAYAIARELRTEFPHPPPGYAEPKSPNASRFLFTE